MAKFCPITNSKVVYLNCLECEDKICEKEKEKKQMKSFAVVFTYSFDSDSSVYLFETEEEAKTFLRQTYEEELRIDAENGRDSEGFINEDGLYANITNSFDDGDDFTEVTEIRVAKVYQ